MRQLDNEKAPYSTDYDRFANIYDAVMGKREHASKTILDLIQSNNPQAKTILELAVGTGTNLVSLAEDYEVSGLDTSAGMLSEASKKLPNVKFYQQDMVTFNLPEKYDVILSIYDSVNHILDFEKWKAMFRNVYSHLNDEGDFIFDVNPPELLDRKLGEDVFVKDIDRVRMEMKVLKEGDVYTWNVKLHTPLVNGEVIIEEENIREIAVPVDEIVVALKAIFSSVEVMNEMIRDSGLVKRVNFCCRK